MTTSRRTVTQGIAWSVPAVAVATAAPAMAATTQPQALCYGATTQVYGEVYNSGVACYTDTYGNSGSTLTALHVSNLGNFDNSPHGFAIEELGMTDGSGELSPKTVATLAEPLQFIVAYPVGMVDTTAANNGFTFSEGGSDWSGPAVRQVQMTNPDGYTAMYDVFTFTWQGNHTQPTVTFDGVNRTPAWEGTRLAGDFTVNTDCCMAVENQRYYYANYYAGGSDDLNNTGTFTTENGYNGTLGSIGWVDYDNYAS